jgi:hypothetical protein
MAQDRDSVAGSCIDSNGSSDSIQGSEFLMQMSNY